MWPLPNVAAETVHTVANDPMHLRLQFGASLHCKRRGSAVNHPNVHGLENGAGAPTVSGGATPGLLRQRSRAPRLLRFPEPRPSLRRDATQHPFPQIRSTVSFPLEATRKPVVFARGEVVTHHRRTSFARLGIYHDYTVI
jgi:hypothetical protein